MTSVTTDRPDDRAVRDFLAANPLSVVLGTMVRGPRNLWSLLVTLILLAAIASAAVSMTYRTQSTATVSLQNPPIVWYAGDDFSGNEYVTAGVISGNRTYFNITVKPLPEANVTWANLTYLKNQASAAKTVTVTGTSLVSYAKIFRWQLAFFHSDNTYLGTLDLLTASPSLSLGSRAAGSNAYTKMYVELADGTGQNDLPSTINIGLTIA
ncbi:MAG: hypothetical protein ACT4PT_04545 [Methanobacteriota archaeon]